jgi:hypothetical protein
MNPPGVNSSAGSVDVPRDPVEITLENYPRNGIYLHLPDGRLIAITRDKIEDFARNFEAQLDQMPAHLRKAVDFQACSICPERTRARFCHALPPTLAFVDELAGFKSFHQVTAVYRGPESTLVVAPNTTMQEALLFVAALSLMYHCEVGKKYWKYFMGVHPLQDPDKLSARVYLNIYWECQGNQAAVQEKLEAFVEDITTISSCQANRLRLIVSDDALINAFASVQSQVVCLAMRGGDHLVQSFEKYLERG